MKNKEQNRLTFEEYDQLDRRKYAEFLIDLAKHAESNEGSYTIAVNSPYGSGKTTLLKMMSSKIAMEYSTKEKPLFVAYYNAWKYDFFNEPLTSLAMSLFDNQALKRKKNYKLFTDNLTKITRFVASLSNDIAIKVTGIDIKEALCAFNIASKTEEAFLEYKNSIEYLEKALDKTVGLYGTNAKMIVIIDELDRCKPDFAIKTLEITKHLLANANIIFLYALDMGQLQKAVEHAYGRGMDSAGYLLRFFDYISIIPEPNISKYLERKVEEIEDQKYVNGVNKELENCYKIFHMTVRDIDRVMSTYKQMYNYFLKDYNNIVAHRLYLHLLCLKLKRRVWFESITNSSMNVDKEFKEFYLQFGRDSESISYRVLRISDGKSIPLMIVENDYLIIEGGINYEIAKDTKGTLNDVQIVTRDRRILIYYSTKDGVRRSPISLNDSVILGYVLFSKDLQRYKSIKARNIPEYIHQHMEFFDFETGLDENKNTEPSTIVVPFPDIKKKSSRT